MPFNITTAEPSLMLALFGNKTATIKDAALSII